EPEVLLGLAAMAILAGMAIISNTKMMQVLGPARWRQYLRLGYVALVLFVIRAYLMEHEVWLAWLAQGTGLPPGRLVLSAIDLGVIGLRGSMIISQFVRKRNQAQAPNQSSPHHLLGGRVVLWLIVVVAVVLAAGYYSYHYLSLRPVVPPAFVPVAPGETAETPEQPAEPSSSAPQPTSDPALSFLKLPPGFVITVFSDEWSSQRVSAPGPGTGPRLMTVRGEAVYLGVPREGRIAVLRDTNADGRADLATTFVSGLKRPHNIAFQGNTAFVAAEDGVWSMRDDNQDHVADDGSVQRIVQLPTGGHWTRTVKVIGDKLYVAVGSSCNVCHEQDERRAAITRCELDGSSCATFAKGLRNTVDFVEYEGVIYGTDNGRDELGNAIPPEEVNVIQEGGNYGWPICYGDRVHDSDFDKNVYIRDPCADSQAPLAKLPAHNAPLGLAVYTGSEFPSQYQGNVFVAAHGSWNRQPPDGYKVFMVNRQSGAVEDFVTGWFQGSTVRGRPVGVVNYQGGLLISDDTAGFIYLVRYAP
ncbi:MAG: PQQ-dependent sugar dehydrogenase, partial [Candidatus Veblenbacteria bacterium]|nr:PQQ-dependent sugar dehydrogenase [Candidatus Veblenbacteria bacterium]